MKPSEVRERTLRDHERIREHVSQVERLARDAAGGTTSLPGPLRSAARTLLDRLRVHMDWEEQVLAPALRDADAWGEERVARLMRDHREQRENLSRVLESLEDPTRPPASLAGQLLELVATLREDMRDEEETALDPKVLRDDVIAVDAEPD